MRLVLDALIAIALTNSVTMAHAPQVVKHVERSVWQGYTGLYKLQQVSESCSRRNTCPGIKAALTWAPVLLNSKVTTNKGN